MASANSELRTEFEHLKRSRKALRDPSYFKFRLADPEYQEATRSSKPQCMLKVTSFGKGARLKTLLEYVSTRTNEAGEKEQLPMESESAENFKGGEAVEEIFADWSRDFERKKRGSKREPRHFTHMILSAKTGNSPEEALRVNLAARDFLQENFAEAGYEYVFVTHRDTEHPHVHVVIKNYNRTLDRKLHLSKAATFDFRMQWAKALEARSIEAVATLRRDRVQVLESVKNGVERIQERETWSDRKRRAAPDMTLQQRKYLSMQISRMKDQVKAATLPFTNARKTNMKLLRDLEQAVREKSEAEIQKSASASLRLIDRDIGGLTNDIVALASSPSGVAEAALARGPKKADAAQKRRQILVQVPRLEKDIAFAARRIKASKMPAGEKLRLAEDLKVRLAVVRELSRVSKKGSRVDALARRRATIEQGKGGY